MPRRWDFGDFKFHPLWSSTPEDSPELAIRPGDVLFRGTTTKFLRGGALFAHPEPKDGLETARMYLSEGEEDAAGYAWILRDEVGGRPILCEIILDAELFADLRPGYEGLGEWYVKRAVIPAENVRCRRAPRVD